MNYFEYHGANCEMKNYDESVALLKRAVFKDFTASFSERRGDGWSEPETCTSAWKFVADGKLYSFSTTHSGQISSFSELNVSKENNCGRIYHFKMLNSADVETPLESAATKDSIHPLVKTQRSSLNFG